MKHNVVAACGCSMGKIRANNEDNFYFNGAILPEQNCALDKTLTLTCSTEKSPCFAIFDGMGGEQHGESAAYAATKHLKKYLENNEGNDQPPLDRLNDITIKLNRAVVREAKKVPTSHMGTTMAGILFQRESAFIFNLGDSRIYAVRGGRMTQLSEDHLDTRAQYSRKVKPSLTQYLGIDEEEFLVEPALREVPFAEDVRFLICSDGLTDMLSDTEIEEIMCATAEPEQLVQRLISAALDKGGKDNTTVIVCAIK